MSQPLDRYLIDPIAFIDDLVTPIIRVLEMQT